MMTLLRRFIWWLRRRRKEAELSEELQFHLEQEERERRAAGLPEDEARWAARRDLGNEARVREDARALWTWRPLDELSQDLRFASRTLFKHRAVAVFAMLSLALGIGANTAIYSFMDAILLRSLPVGDPSSLVVMTWRSKPFDFRKSDEFVLHSVDGSVYPASSGLQSRIFPFPAFERLREVSAPVLSTIFARFPAGKLTVLVDGEAELANAEYVVGRFLPRHRAVAGRGPAVAWPKTIGHPRHQLAVINAGYAERRFGSVANAAGRQILINNISFTVVGVTPPEFDGIDPGITTERVPAAGDDPSVRSGPRRPIPRSELLLGGDHGTPSRRRHSRAGAVGAGGAVCAVGRTRPRRTIASAPTCRVLAARRWRRRSRHVAAEVLEAAVAVDDNGGPDPRDCVRERGQSAAGACHHAPA